MKRKRQDAEEGGFQKRLAVALWGTHAEPVGIAADWTRLLSEGAERRCAEPLRQLQDSILKSVTVRYSTNQGRATLAVTESTVLVSTDALHLILSYYLTLS